MFLSSVSIAVNFGLIFVIASVYGSTFLEYLGSNLDSNNKTPRGVYYKAIFDKDFAKKEKEKNDVAAKSKSAEADETKAKEESDKANQQIDGCLIDVRKKLKTPSSLYSKVEGPTHGLYMLHKVALSWYDALEACSAENAYLVVIDTKEEAEALSDWMQNNPVRTDKVWVGLHSAYSDSEWFTIFGEKLSEVYNTGEDDFGQNGKKSSEKCATVNFRAKELPRIMDVDCDDRVAFVCEHFHRYL